MVLDRKHVVDGIRKISGTGWNIRDRAVFSAEENTAHGPVFAAVYGMYRLVQYNTVRD